MLGRVNLALRKAGLFIMVISLVTAAFVVVNLGHTSADDLPVVHESGFISSDETWTAGSVYLIDSAVTIWNGSTLTIEPGAIVKTHASGSNVGIIVHAGTTLDVNGTSGSPVLFTSSKDDSFGGDSEGDGATSGQAADYGTAIEVDGGTADVQHADFHYAYQTINSDCSSSLTVTDSVFNDSGVSLACAQAVSLERNQFVVTDAYPVYASNLDVSGIVLAGSDKNTFTGSGKDTTLFLVSDVVGGGKVWNVGGASGATLWVSGLGVHGTLDVEAGTIVKTNNSSTGIVVYASGDLEVAGSSGSPVVFTGIEDDAIGGDANGDGTTSGTAGDYLAAISTQTGATVQIAHAGFYYGSTALDIDGGETNLASVDIAHVANGVYVNSGSVIIRGTLSDISSKGVRACDWGQTDCNVDAAYTDWGNANGPFATAGVLVCGQVTVSPWNVGSSTASDSIFAVDNCDGSPRADVQLNSATATFYSGIASKGIDCGNGFHDACVAMTTAFSCLSAAVGLAASQSPIPTSFTDPTALSDTVSDDAASAANTYMQGLESESNAAFTTTVSGGIVHVLGLFHALDNAYNNCAP